MLFEIFFDGFLGFADVDGKKNEALRSEFLADFVDEGSFIGAVTAPGGPKFEKSNATFPLMESFVNFSPVVVIAEKRGAGSLWLEPAARPIALASRAVESAPRRKMGRTDMP